MRTYIFGLFCAAVLASADAAHAQCPSPIPYTFSPSTSAVASQVNSNFTASANCWNGGTFTNGTITNAGSVGIGYATLGANTDLAVNGNVAIGTNTAQGGPWRLTANGGQYGIISNVSGGFGVYGSDAAGTGPSVGVYGTSASSVGVGVYGTSSGSGMGGYFTSSGGYALITGTGNVGVGTASPTYLLQVGSPSASGIVAELQNSAGACTYTPGASSVTVTCSSDVRFKTDIADSGDALGWLDGMRVRDFTVRTTGERRTGIIAQEMLSTHRAMVHLGPDGYYKVDEPNPWKLVKAIQEQQKEIEQLKATVASLKAGK